MSAQASEPGHAIYGEEQGVEMPSARSCEQPKYCWVLDPIDGTKSFATGSRMYCTLVGLVNSEGEAIVGVNDSPMLGDRFAGCIGSRRESRVATMNGEAMDQTPAGSMTIERASVYSTTPFMFSEGSEWEAYSRLAMAFGNAVFGCDGYAYGLAAAGYVGAVVEADLKAHDVLAHDAVIRAAGGELTRWGGGRVRWWPGRGPERIEAVASADTDLHARALQRLSEA
jgi:fructose-1,6-bisphosphatase/inositol monophosphatase family enzyme